MRLGSYSGVAPFAFLLLLSVVSAIAQSPIKYQFEYKCNNERVVVNYCRNDPGGQGWSPVDEGSNYCNVEYPDRPRSVPSIAVFASVLKSELVKKLSACGAISAETSNIAGQNAGSGSTDADIVKARAAKVDTSILGMQLGEPLRLANCPLFSLGLPTQNCYEAVTDLVEQISKGLGLESTVSENVKIVTLITKNCPPWVTNCTAYITVHDGKLDGVALYTNGRNALSAVTRDLTAKYGKPTSVVSKTFKPDVGNPFSYSQPSWTLPGLRVTYDVVFNMEDDSDTERANSKVGLVRIMTESEYQRRLAKQKAPVKTKL